MAKLEFIATLSILLICSVVFPILADTVENATNKSTPIPPANTEKKPNDDIKTLSSTTSTIAASLSSVAPHQISMTTSFKSNATANCVCDGGALLPRIGDNGVEMEICPDCKCKHVSRNTTLIKVVVILVIWIISILVIYMLFLMCLDPLLNKRVKANYQEHTNEDDETASAAQFPAAANQEINARANVLNRVGHQQDKWKRQVREQRRHIYDRRTMLN